MPLRANRPPSASRLSAALMLTLLPSSANSTSAPGVSPARSRRSFGMTTWPFAPTRRVIPCQYNSSGRGLIDAIWVLEMAQGSAPFACAEAPCHVLESSVPSGRTVGAPADSQGVSNADESNADESADERTRTSTWFPRHGPEPCASTNSATSACRRASEDSAPERRGQIGMGEPR